ncbi:MAG: MarR family transcriptional regulator, partial [DPANN group archaeon]|nr:MarR family transcriptional regulator [DPANN group archaeon]
EKQVLELIQDSRTIFQADLIEKTGFGKAKITRILDRLEGRDFIERKRRGMTNVVVVKE